jgi:hypothetical protein
MQNKLTFQSRIDALQTQFPLVLNQVIQHTILEKKNPGVSQYALLLQGSTAELHSQTSQLKQISATINETLSQISMELVTLNKKIEFETNREKRMEHKLARIIPEENGSQMLVDDYTTLYSEQYAKNALTATMIIAVAVKIGKLLKA